MLWEGLRTISNNSDALNPVRVALKRSIRGPDLRERRLWKTIERRRQEIANGNDTITFQGQQMSLAAHGAAVSSDRPWTDFLFQLTRVVRPHAVLELGTNIGMSGSYLAAALRTNGAGHLWTIEGIPDLAKAAQQTFQSAELDPWATSVVGWFKDALSTTLSNGPFQLVFIDGHHNGDATIDYYRQIKPHLGDNSFLVFDDINWSRGMQQGWQTITEDKDIRDCAAIMGFGVVSIN